MCTQIKNQEVIDKNAYISELISSYETDVWNYAFYLTKKMDVADDMTQEVFLKAYQKLETFQGKCSIKTWLLTITRNMAINYRRSAFIRKVMLVDDLIDHRIHPSAENEAIENIELNDVMKVVLRLPGILREVLILHVTHQLSITEIASLLGISESAVKSRLHRARVKVSSMLMKEGEINDKATV